MKRIRSAAPSVLGSSKKRATFSTPWSHMKDTKPSMDDTTRPSNPLMVKKNDYYYYAQLGHTH